MVGQLTSRRRTDLSTNFPTIGAARGIPLEEVAEATTETAEKFFRFSP